MQRLILAALAGLLFAGPVLAQDQAAIARATADYRAAKAHHDTAAANAAHERLMDLYKTSYDVREADKQAVQPAPPGVPHALYEQVVQAHLAHEEALASGDKARIATSEANLLRLYKQEYEAAHHHG
jgi:hypothetical protein